MTDFEKYKLELSDHVTLYLKRDEKSPHNIKDITYKALDSLEGHFIEHDALPAKVKEARKKRHDGLGHSVEQTHPRLFKAIHSTLTNTCGETAHFRMDMIESPHKTTKEHAIRVFEHSGKGIKAKKIKTVRRRR